MIHVSIQERGASAQATEPITAGSVGLEVRFRFSEDWEGLSRAAVFRGSGLSRDAALSEDRCAVPHEVLQTPGGHLRIGVYGTGSQGQRVTPTVWADAGPIREGAAPAGVESVPATESLVQQLLAAAQAAHSAAQSVRDDADAGDFDGADGKSAYQLAVDGGFVGTEAAWLASLHGRDATVDATLSNAGEAADAAETGKIKAAAEQNSAELAAITPASGAGDFVWTLGKNWSASGSYGAANGFARSNYIDAAPGVVVQNLSRQRDGSDKTTSFYVHEFDGGTWLRRTYAASGDHVVVGENANKLSFAFGYPSAQNVTITQELVDENFSVRIVRKPSGGSGGASDYAELSNKPQIGGVTLLGNKTAEQLGLAKASDIPAVPVQSVNGKTGAVTLAASDVGAVAAAQGAAHAGEFCVVGSDGTITTMALSAWQGGSY